MLYTTLAACQIALVVLWARPAAPSTTASVPNAVLTLVGVLALGLLSFVEHQRTIRPSLLVEFYLFLSLLFDSARVRTLWLQRFNSTIAAISTVAFAIRLILLVLEAISKKNILRANCKTPSVEARSGLFAKSFFLWLNPLLRTGYSRSISINDLPALDKHLTSDYLFTKLQIAWTSLSKKLPRQLLLLYFRKLGWHILSVVPPRLALIGFTFCQPFLIERAVEYSQEPVTTHSTNEGYGMIGAYAIVYIGIAVTNGQYQHLVYRSITMARGGLVSMLFVKGSTLKSNAVDPSASLTLMSADIERITNGWQTMHELWANSLEVAVAIYLLDRQLGAACAIPLAVAICKFKPYNSLQSVQRLRKLERKATPLTVPLLIVSLLGAFFVMNMVVRKQALWLEAIERRISATTNMLGSMKRIKMCGLTDIISETLQGLRVEELRISKGFRRLLVGSIFFAFTTPIIAPVLTFAVFAIISLRSDGASTLDTTTAFTSLSLFALLADPLASLILAINSFAGSLGSFDRIQAFLETTEHADKRILPLQAHCDSTKSSQVTGGNSDKSLALTEKAVTTSAIEKPIFPFAKAERDAICVEDGNFSWDTEKDAIISSIQIKIPRGQLTMIVGPVGCGKTTLLKALLGEIPAISGAVEIFSDSISYCDQSPFHMNGTVRDSISAFSEPDDRWYSTVVEACALEEDLRQMPLGDQTRIGSKGIALSGGQCQRLALARAAYARHDTCILDDVLSGLDMDTENKVFHGLLGLDGLLRRQCATVILASSSSKRIPFADHIIVLNENGKIAEQGSFKELVASGGYVSCLDLQPADWRIKSKQSDLNQLLPSVTKYIPSTLKPKTMVEEAEFEANKRTGDLSIYAYYTKSVGWVSVLIFVVAVSAYVFCISFPQIWLAWWAYANVERPNERLGYWLGIYALLGVLGLASLVVSCWKLIITMVPQSGGNFHLGLLRTVLAAPMSFFSTTDTGTTLNRFSQDLQLIDMDLPLSALNCFTAFVLCIAQIILIGISSVYAAISFPVMIAALYIIQKFYLRTSRQIRFLDLEAKAPLYTQFSETLSGLVTVRAFGWQNALEKKNRFLLDQSQRPFYLLFSVQRWLQLVLDLVVAAVAVMLMVLVVELRGVLSGAYVGIALLNVILFSQHLKLLLQYWTLLETHIGAVARIKNFVGSTTAESLPELDAPPQDWPARGAIEFSSVNAGYDASRAVLKDLTLSVQAGEKIGICGRTGSGKSSLILAIFGMCELHSGSIVIDGVDLSSIPRQDARSKIVGLPQDAFLLNGTVRLNADPYKKATDKAIIGALQDVKLWHCIQEKGGLDADIDVVKLSHGQKQLFCVAQALLRQSSILILDEATSR